MNPLVTPVSKVQVRNNVSNLHPRNHRTYSIYFDRKFLKFFHTRTMRSEMRYTQFRILYQIINAVCLELEIEILEKQETSITSTLIQKFIRFSDFNSSTVIEELNKSYNNYKNRTVNIADWFQSTYNRFIEKVGKIIECERKIGREPLKGYEFSIVKDQK